MKVAIIHDWLVTYAGAEKVLEQIVYLFPEAEVYTLINHLSNEDTFLKNKEVKTSFIQNLPFSKKKYRAYLPVMPIAIEQFDLSSYDLIISSSHAVAKGVITGPDQLHICYCHSPIRYAWDLQSQYLKESGLESGFKSVLTRYLLHKIRNWDYRTANGVDYFISNSDYIARRIKKVYRRESKTIYPNVDISAFEVQYRKEDFYFTASRLVPYKKIDLIVKSFSKMPEKKLVVIGDGPQFKKIKMIAPPNVTLLGYQDSTTLKSYMKRARAFIFAAEEDFGIIPVEAQACGTPVIAYGKGGALETVIEGVTGVFFDEQSEISLISAIKRFEKIENFNSADIRRNAERFSTLRFREEFKTFVDDKYTNFLEK